MAGYFDGKKISTVYLGTTLIYREEVEEEEIVPRMTIQRVHIEANDKKGTRLYVNDARAKEGQVVMSNDLLRIVMPESSRYTFTRAPSYYQKDPPVTSQTSFEIKVSEDEWATRLPYGYDEEREWSKTIGLNIPTKLK